MKPDSRKERSAMGNRAVQAVMFSFLLLFTVGLFAQGTGSDWQYANVFNTVYGGYGNWIPSWYSTDFRDVTSYTWATPTLRTAFMRGGTREETRWVDGDYVTVSYPDEQLVPVNHDQTALRLDLLSGTEDKDLKGVTITLWGSPDFNPNEDLAPVFPDSAKNFYCVSDTVKDRYTGVQFYIEKGTLAHSCVDSLDSRDIEGLPEQLMTDLQTIQIGTTNTTFNPTYKWVGVSSPTETAPRTGWKMWKATFYFENGIRIPYEGTFNRTEYGLPFYRIWVVMRPIGAHRCIIGTPGGGLVEGLSNRDSFYVQISDANDLVVHNLLGVNPSTGYPIVSVVDMALGRDDVRYNNPIPDPVTAARWSRSELIVGGDTIAPFISDLVPYNQLRSNRGASDYGCAAETLNTEIWTADSCQPISFVAWDKSTGIDSVFVELRYLNTGIFYTRVDSIVYRSMYALSPDSLNGGPGVPWMVNVKKYLSSWLPMPLTVGAGTGRATEFNVIQSGPCAGNFCGHDTFFIDPGNNGDYDLIDPFDDGSHVQVTVRVFNRNYNTPANHHARPTAVDAYQDTTWDFWVDLSGPNAELVCPGISDDNLTREFYGGSTGFRQDYIEAQQIDYRFISDSLPLVQVRLYDEYEEVHDVTNHRSLLRGGEGGSGINVRNFEFTFILHRLVCEEAAISYVTDTFVVDESDLNNGCWFDEANDGMDGTMWINFEELLTYRTDLTGTTLNDIPLVPFVSGDILEVQLTQLFDDPDYGQGAFRVASYGAWHTGPVDMAIAAYGSDSGPEGNYGVRNRNLVYGGDAHFPVDDEAALAYDTDVMVDTLGFLRIDLEGPVAPNDEFYPSNGWVSSDSLQVITVDLYDEIGCAFIDENMRSDDNDLYKYVAGVYGGNDDLASRIAINLTVRRCDGTWHTSYVANPARPWEGKTWYMPGWIGTACGSQPHHIEKIDNKWGTRLTFDPNQVDRGAGAFRSGDKVCVTVYAYDNAVTTDCPYNENVEEDLLCNSGSTWETVTNWVPGRNEGLDVLEPDELVRTVSEIARFEFFVDLTPPQFIESVVAPICDDTLEFYLRDFSNPAVSACDEWFAGIGAADLKITIWDDDSARSNDFVFFNDLIPSVPYGTAKMDVTAEIPGREERYVYARMDFSGDTYRDGVIKVWSECGVPNSCHFFEPGDSVKVEIWAGDNPQVPWYGTDQRPYSEPGYYAFTEHDMYAPQHVWEHYEDDLWLNTTCSGWRRGAPNYTNMNHDESGIGWLDTVLWNYENPNWNFVHEETFKVNSEIYVKDSRWFNEDAFDKWNDADFGASLFWDNTTDLTGLYSNMMEIPDTSVHTAMSAFVDDDYLTTYARDLQYLQTEIYTCTDSIIMECLTGSWPVEDSLTGRVPHVTIQLYNSARRLVWERVEHYDCHCTSCFFHYTPLRECCKDGGIVTIGPLNQFASYMTTPRDTVTSLSMLHPDQDYRFIRTTPDTLIEVFGYMNGDSLVVTLGFNSRNPNQFNNSDETVRDYHEYRWFYNIDMLAPNGIFRVPEATAGYAEVDCNLMHADNNQVRIRLESITDAGVGLDQGSANSLWTTLWPNPVVESGTDWVNYKYDTYTPEAAGLVYNPGTHYIYSNENFVVHNCAEENSIASSMSIPAVTMYSGLDADDNPIQSTISVDTVKIADSIFVTTTIQDKLGNEKVMKSANLGLDNGLPEVRGFAFSSYDASRDMFDNWDRDFCLLPWEVPDQESLCGIYNFGTVCTVYVRLWFNDNMDMREADPSTGYIVRYKPEGWTHWFPVIPIATHAGYYPLSTRYVNYDYTGGTSHVKSVDPSSTDEVFSDDAEAMFYDNGWNTDREWIGYMVIAGDDMMDGIATLRIQGFDDNAANNMLAQEFAFRIESQIQEPSMYWPSIDSYDYVDASLITGYDADRELGDFCSYVPNSFCKAVTAYGFDRSISDSVRFDFYWSDAPVALEDLISRIDSSVTPYDTIWTNADFHYTIDDMSSEDIWWDVEGIYSWAQTPCDIIDIAHQYAVRGTLMNLVNQEKYITIRFRSFSRFYPEDYVENSTWNVLIDNKGNYADLTDAHSGDYPAGTDLIVFPAVTSETRICITGEDIDQIDYALFYMRDMITDVVYPVTDFVGPSYDDDFLPVGIEGIDPMFYNSEENVICFDYSTPDGMRPGLFQLCGKGYDELGIVTDYVDGAITGHEDYTHNFCFCRDSILVPDEAFLVRGDGWSDAILTVCDNYPTETDCDNIYPWSGEDNYSDWPGWVNVSTEIVDGYDHVNRFQVITYNNPDYTTGADPLMHSYTENGGYPGDSIYVLFRVQDADSIKLNISDEFGGDISGSNLEIIHMLTSSDIRVYNGENYFVYNWIVDDQDNRFDGPAKITVTKYQRDVSDRVVATDHISYALIDTYDPSYSVSATRYDGTALLTCVNADYPRETIWVTNADTINLRFDWDQTLYDQDPSAEGYMNYNPWALGRIWDRLRLTIDGAPHYGGIVDDPNDHREARLWQRSIVGPIDGFSPFWLTPGTDVTLFGDDVYDYRWDVSNDEAAQGIAKVLVKGRDIAGNILEYEEAEFSTAFGKFVLVDVEDPILDASLIHLTSAEFTADAGAVDDNFLGEGFVDPVSGSYVYNEIYTRDGATLLASGFWTNEDGSISSGLVSLTAGDTVLVCATDLAGNRTCAEVEVMPHVECCTYELLRGFNMIAISVNPTTPYLAGDLFPGMDVYKLVGGDYTPVAASEELNTADGYLVMASVPTVITACGDPNETFVASGLMSGWNLIGGPWTSIPTTSAGVDPAGAIDLTNVHYYDAAAGAYRPTEEFEHCRGHLVMATVDDVTVTVPATLYSKYSYEVEKETVSDIDWSANISVESGNLTRTLTFGTADNAKTGIDNADITLFPAFPGTADAYLDNHLSKSIVNSDNQSEWNLVVSDFASVTVDLSNVSDDWDIYINGINAREVSNFNLDAGTYKINAAYRFVPSEYSLAQNSPNPFNPMTSINYYVPAEGPVKIEVYNVLGENLRTLVDDVKTAGSWTARWDGYDNSGNRLSSGVYFYKMTSGSFSETKKMTLMR